VHAAAPTDVEVARLLAAVRGRIVRLVRRHGINLEGGFEDEQAADQLRLDSAVLAQIQGASVLGRVATGPRAGHRVLRFGQDPAAPVVTSGGPRHAHFQGFDLHANVAVAAGEREQLEHLCRYVLRPPVAQGALQLTPDGKVLLRLRRAWRDGTRAIRFEPSELLEKLAAMIPRPRANLLIYHGAFAPRGCCRGAPAGETGEHAAPEPAGEPTPAGGGGSGDQPVDASAAAAGGTSRIDADGVAAAAAIARPPPGYVRPPHYAWADLLRHTFSTDILGCPDCGGRLRLLATITDTPARGFRRAGRPAIEKILRHLGLPADLPNPAPARAPPWLPGVPDQFDDGGSADREWPD